MESDDALAPLYEALEDTHHFLHACERGYHSPSAFRRNLNAFIQAARNVTFRLQSMKAHIPDFDDWYSEWQDYLRADPVMLWVHNARTEVVKRRGLATMSTAKYSLIYSYGQPVSETVEVPPETPTAEILIQAIGRVPFNIRDRALVTIEREWVAEKLPGRELLGALDHCLTTLAALADEARARMAGGQSSTPKEAIRAFERPGCLAELDRARLIRVHPGTGEIYALGEEPIPRLDDEVGRKQVLKYEWSEESIKKYASAEPFEKAEGLAELSVKTLRVDGYHTSFAMIRDAEGRWRPVMFAPEDQLDKYILWHHVASLVRQHRADALLFVGEFWAVPLDLLLKAGVSDIEEAPGRREQLMVFVETSDGRHRSWVTPFHHRLGRIAVGRQQIDDEYMPPMLEPVREVWRAGFDVVPDKERSVLLGSRITESRLIDRVRAAGLHVPVGIERDPNVTLALVTRTAPFVVDEVALYLALSSEEVLRNLGSLPDMQLDELPPNFFMESVKPMLSLANPFPSAWGVAFESRTSSELKKDEKKRVFSHPDEVWGKILELSDTFEWILSASLILEHVPYTAVGPVADAFFGIESDGRAHVLGFSHGATADLMGVTEDDAGRLASALFAPATAAIQLLNRGVAKRSHVRPPRRASRRHRRKRGAPLAAYEIVSVEGLRE